MPRRSSHPSSHRRHWFFWVAVAAVPLCAVVVVGAALAIGRYGPYVQNFGWTALATRHGVIVASVDPGGPADGKLHPGDAIVSVSAGVIPPVGIYRRAAPTDHPYTIRVASPRPIDVELAAPLTRTGPLGRLMATFLVALAFIGVGLFLGLARPDLPVARLLFLGCLGTGFLQLSTLDAFSDQLPEAGRLVNGVLILFHGVPNAIWFHAAVRFPGPVPPRLIWPGLGIVLYALGATTLATFGIPSLILWWSDVDAASRILFGWSAWLGIGWAAFVLAGVLINAGIVVVLVWKLAFVRDPEDQRRLRWLFAGCIVSVVPLIAYRIAQASFISADPGAFREGAFRTIATAINVIVPLTLTYAIARHRVLDITVVLRQGMQYLLARNALTIILLLPAFALAFTVVANQNRTIRETLFENPTYLALIGAGLLALRFRRTLGARLDRVFFREAYDRERVLRALLDEMDRLDSIDEVAALVGAELTRALHPQHVYVWLRAREKDQFALAHSSGVSMAAGDIPPDSRLAEAFEQHPRAREWRDNGDGSDADREWLDRLEVELIVPVLGTDRHLSGLVMLGEKKSEEAYCASDRELLEAIARQLGVVRENLRLKERVDEERQLRNQVVDRLEGRAINLVKECPRCGACYDSAASRCSVDGEELTIPLPVDRLIEGQYRLDRLIATGGMGTVYEAEDLRLQRTVAIKFVIGRAFGEQAALRRFEREARLCARLTHPNIVTVFAYGTLPASGAYLVMERLHGVTLREELRRIGQLQPEAAAEMFDQVLEGIKAAHEAGIIHRDLKPANVLIVDAHSESRRVKLLDFGLAQLRPAETAATATLSAEGAVMGTLGYMAPEQFSGVQVDQRADIFAFGVMLAEALTGTRPFDRPTFAAVVASTQLEDFHLPGEAPAIRTLDALLQRCLAKQPASRFASAADVQREMIPALRACAPHSLAGRDTWRGALHRVDRRQSPGDEAPTRER
jgi:serine/threonine protein kinase